MRQCEPTHNLFTIPIESIESDTGSRDNIPLLVRGVQHVYCQPRLRDRKMTLLASYIALTSYQDNGRPSMNLWSAMVQGLLKQELNADYDHLQEMANEHEIFDPMLQ